MAASAADARPPGPAPAAGAAGRVRKPDKRKRVRTRAQKDARNERERLGNITPEARAKRNARVRIRNERKNPNISHRTKPRGKFTPGGSGRGNARGTGLARLGLGASLDESYATLYARAEMPERLQAAEARAQEAEARAQAAEARAQAAEARATEAEARARKLELKAGAAPTPFEEFLTTKGTQTESTGTATEAAQPAEQRRETLGRRLRQRAARSGLQEHPQAEEYRAWQKQSFTQDLEICLGAERKARSEAETRLQQVDEWHREVGITDLARKIGQAPSRSALENSLPDLFRQ